MKTLHRYDLSVVGKEGSWRWRDEALGCATIPERLEEARWVWCGGKWPW
ncbi:MAG: hypothetical protein ACP5Q4_06760 [Candidatus Caldatribacteriaceae bacterium]